MTNFVAIEGYVKKVSHKNNHVMVQISVPDGKDQSGKMKYCPATVDIIVGQGRQAPSVQEGQILLAIGRYRKFKLNDQWYDQISCWESDVRVTGQPSSQNSQESSDDIPF